MGLPRISSVPEISALVQCGEELSPCLAMPRELGQLFLESHSFVTQAMLGSAGELSQRSESPALSPVCATQELPQLLL